MIANHDIEKIVIVNRRLLKYILKRKPGNREDILICRKAVTGEWDWEFRSLTTLIISET
jgi:hypothetical protein